MNKGFFAVSNIRLHDSLSIKLVYKNSQVIPPFINVYRAFPVAGITRKI